MHSPGAVEVAVNGKGVGNGGAPAAHFEGDFDELLDLVGGFGPFQWRLYLYMQLPFVFLGFIYIGQIWLVLEPDHWCSVPTLQEAGWSEERIAKVSVPMETHHGVLRLSQCKMYDIDYNGTDFSVWTPTNATTVVPCRHGWTYNFSEIYPTIVSDLDWVCDNAWKPTFASSFFFVGASVGTAFFSHFSDEHGRLPTLIITNLVACVAGAISAFSNSFAMFVITRFAYGLSFNLQCTQAMVLLSEFVGPKHRSMALNLPLATTLCFTMALMPWMAKLLYHWQYMALATSLPMGLIVIYLFLDVPESCRWLQQKGHLDRAMLRMRNVAVTNGKHISEEQWRQFEEAAQRRHQQELEHPVPSLLELLRYPRQRRRTCLLVACSMIVLLCFDLIVRNTQLDVDIYTGQSLLALSEAPADLLTWLLLETVGRRWTSAGTMVGCSVLAGGLSLLLIDGSLPFASTVVAFICRCFSTIGVNSILEQCIELFPTDVRSRGFGLTQVAGELATAASPAILFLEKYGRGVPMAILAGLALISSVVLSFLPETKDYNLPNTLRQGEQFGKEQKYWQWYCTCPCARTPGADDTSEHTTSCLGVDNVAMTSTCDEQTHL